MRDPAGLTLLWQNDRVFRGIIFIGTSSIPVQGGNGSTDVGGRVGQTGKVAPTCVHWEV